MNRWEETIEASKFRFIEALERRGFQATGESVVGEVRGSGDPVSIRINLPVRFPFDPPIVFPPDDFPRSWHREFDGAMCLYAADGRENLPWLDVDDFLATLGRWVTESRSGWTGDLPDLDLDRYFRHFPEPLVVYPELDELSGRFVQFRRTSTLTRLTGPGSVPRGKGRLSRKRSFGYVADIGDPPNPPATWDALKLMLPSGAARTIEAAVSDRRLEYIVLRYSRRETNAAVVLRIWKDQSGLIELASVHSASESSATLRLRAAATGGKLEQKRVAVIGAGAVGSIVADLLTRAGIGELALYDPDLVKPGNLIRHLVGDEFVGVTKPIAVKRTLDQRSFNQTSIDAKSEHLLSPKEVMQLIHEYDLVIDASASGSETHLLAEAATSAKRHILSVCLQEDGAVARVDIIPPLDGLPNPKTELGSPPNLEDLRFEAGCGDPVSLTPAFAVYEAAALASRHAVGLLMGTPISSAGETRDYR